MKPKFSIDSEQIYALLQEVIRTAPPFDYEAPLSMDDLRWLARAETLIEASDSASDLISFRVAKEGINTYTHSRNKIMGPLLNVLERVELYAPRSSQGRFVAPGDTWNGYAALVRLMQPACDDLLIVDPYLSSGLFLELLPHTNATTVRCFATKQKSYHDALSAAFVKWRSDSLGAEKPVEFRYAPERSLHDRLVIIDRAKVWLVSQSFKDIAARSPASLLQADPEMAAMKVAHYTDLWAQGTPI